MSEIVLVVLPPGITVKQHGPATQRVRKGNSSLSSR
jgi:hypothetical protein